jgi:hypothetical protein
MHRILALEVWVPGGLDNHCSSIENHQQQLGSRVTWFPPKEATRMNAHEPNDNSFSPPVSTSHLPQCKFHHDNGAGNDHTLHGCQMSWYHRTSPLQRHRYDDWLTGHTNSSSRVFLWGVPGPQASISMCGKILIHECCWTQRDPQKGSV